MRNLHNFSKKFNTIYLYFHQGIKAREILHTCMEKIIEEKLRTYQSEGHMDAFDYMLSSAKENGHELNVQELKVAYQRVIYNTKELSAYGNICSLFTVFNE